MKVTSKHKTKNRVSNIELLKTRITIFKKKKKFNSTYFLTQRKKNIF